MDSDRGSQSPASIIDENEESIILVPLSKPGSRTSEGSTSSARKSDSGKNDSVSDNDNDIVNLTRAEKRDLLAGIQLMPGIFKLLQAQQGKDTAPVDPIVPAMVQAINMTYSKDDCLELLSKIFDCVVVTEKSDRSGTRSKKFTIEFDLVHGCRNQCLIPELK